MDLQSLISTLGDSPGKCDDCWRKCCPDGNPGLHEWRMAWFEVRKQHSQREQETSPVKAQTTSAKESTPEVAECVDTRIGSAKKPRAK